MGCPLVRRANVLECAGQEQDTGPISQGNSLRHPGLSQPQVSSVAPGGRSPTHVVHWQGN